jgi:hypothetical protein
MKTWLRAGLCGLAAVLWLAPRSCAESLEHHKLADRSHG